MDSRSNKTDWRTFRLLLYLRPMKKKDLFVLRHLLVAIVLCMSVATAFAAEGALPVEDVANVAGVAPANEGIYDQIIDWYNDHLNYGTVALLMATESSFIPFPSELVVPPAAYKAMQPDSDLNIILVIVFASLGAMAGAYFNYYFAKLLGRPVIYKFADSRLGHFFLIDVEKVEKAEQFFRDHGAISTLVGRLIPVIRQLISIPAGIAKMKLLPFTLFTAIGAIFWNIILAILGYVAHGQKDIIQTYSHELSVGLIGLGALFIAYMVWNALKPKK